MKIRETFTDTIKKNPQACFATQLSAGGERKEEKSFYLNTTDPSLERMTLSFV